MIDCYEVLNVYSKGFENFFNFEVIWYSKFKVVIDYCYGVLGVVLL